MKPNSIRHYYNYLSYTLIDNREYHFIKMSDRGKDYSEIHGSGIEGFREQMPRLMVFLPLTSQCNFTDDSPENLYFQRHLQLLYERYVVIQGMIEYQIGFFCYVFRVPVDDVYVSIIGTGEEIELRYNNTLFCKFLLEISTERELEISKDDTEYIFISIITYRATHGVRLGFDFNVDCPVHMLCILKNFMVERGEDKAKDEGKGKTFANMFEMMTETIQFLSDSHYCIPFKTDT